MPTPTIADVSAQSRSPFWHFVVLGALTIVVWVVLLAPATDSYGLHYAYLLESGNPARFLQSDHMLWHLLCWAVWLAGRQFAAGFSGLVAQQAVNLLLFLSSLLALWVYSRRHKLNYWLPALGLMVSYTSLKALVGGDVAAGPLLMMVLVLFILPDASGGFKMLPSLVILSLAPLFHKSLFLLIAGWWLAECILGRDPFSRRLIRSSLTALGSVLISLAFYLLLWFFPLSSQKSFSSWLFLYGNETQGFFSLNPWVMTKGLGVAIYRSFLSVTPFKTYALGNIWGLVGIIASGIAIISTIKLVLGMVLGRLKKQQALIGSSHVTSSILLVSLPSLLFFLFWIPGYYTYWTRFLPYFWLLVAFYLPRTKFWSMANVVALGLLIVVNYPSQYSVKDGEEAGRFCRWLSPWLHNGDLVILPGNGIFFFGTMPRYYYGVEVVTLDVLEKQDNPTSWLQVKDDEIRQQGHRVWLLMDYAEWTSERVIHGEQAKYDKGIQAVQQAFILGPRAEFKDPAMKEAWIAECLPRQ